MELSPGLHRVEAPLGERYVALYLVVGDDGALLVDTGVADSLPAVLLPYMAQAGIDPIAVRYVLNTHGDFDHVGGNAAARQAFAAAMFVCGEEDRRLVANVETMIKERYGEFAADHGHDDPDETKEYIRAATGTTRIDMGLRGGERIDLGGRVVEVLHTPGHSGGHLAVLDPSSGALLIGDAVLRSGLLTTDGSPAFPPTYRDVGTYRATIARLGALEPSLLLSSHYPVYRGNAVRDFFAESLAYTDLVETVVTRVLRDATESVSLLQLVERSRSALGTWDAAAAALLVYPLLGTLEALEHRGLVRRQRSSDDGRAQFALAR